MGRAYLPLLLSLSLTLACGDDSTSQDASVTDSEGPGMTDATGSVPDARADAQGFEDAVGPDVGTVDSGEADSGIEPDAGTADSGACIPTTTASTSSTPPDLLSETGLYVDIINKTVAGDVEMFEPANILWSDGAAKTRWVHLPECGVIDTSDMDHWVLPVGTKLYKQFVVQNKRIETRVITRFGPGENDFHFAAYAWNDTETEATRVPLGVMNARGTNHDIPSQAHCMTCHGHLPERALGFSAVQLSHSGAGVNMANLSNDGRLSQPAPNGFPVLGDPTVSAALGYLHANCGNCHNESRLGIRFITPFSLRFTTTTTSAETSNVYRTAVGVPLERFINPPIAYRVVPGDADNSAVYFRMSMRGVGVVQMPPIGTEVTDPAGLAIIRTWIESLQ